MGGKKTGPAAGEWQGQVNGQGAIKTDNRDHRHVSVRGPSNAGVSRYNAL
jgi:hypothetical protein